VKATKKFTGAIEQIPPAHSAIKKEGTPAYKLARKGY
jgi:tRNA pseudouridine55 synthase